MWCNRYQCCCVCLVLATCLTMGSGIATSAASGSVALLKSYRIASILTSATGNQPYRAIVAHVAGLQSAQKYRFEELGRTLSWLMFEEPIVGCREFAGTLRLQDGMVGDLSIAMRARCAKDEEVVTQECRRYQVILGPFEGRERDNAPMRSPDVREVMVHGSGEVVWCRGERLARLASLELERQVLFQPWVEPSQAHSADLHIDLLWSLIP